MDWDDVVKALAEVGAVNVLLFVFYIIFVQLVVMNVVTGLFLQSAIEQAQQDQEHGIQVRLEEKQVFVERLETLFKELDLTNDGSISLQEFEAHLQSEHMQALLQTFEIENADAWTFFKLLDADGGGSVDIDEFVSGCIRLKGNARSIQIAQLMYHHKWIMNQLVELGEAVLNSSTKQNLVMVKLEALDTLARAKAPLPDEAEIFLDPGATESTNPSTSFRGQRPSHRRSVSQGVLSGAGPESAESKSARASIRASKLFRAHSMPSEECKSALDEEISRMLAS